MFNQLGVIGCGLMGGSFALALKSAGLVKHVVGYSKSMSTSERARGLGVIDAIAESAQQAVSDSDIVLIAVPVAASQATFEAIRQFVKPGMLIMDVGSTKCEVTAAASRVLGERVASFVPAHPIAGKELAGVEHADATLYQGRHVILTPLPQTNADLLQKATDAWSAIGARVLSMSPEDHDAAFAAVSHLPHLLAFAYFSAIAQQAEGAGYLSLAGPGFRDFTRIACSDATVWRDILMSNREQVLKQSQAFRTMLDGFEKLLQDGDGEALEARLRQTSDARSHWHMSPVGGPKTSKN